MRNTRALWGVVVSYLLALISISIAPSVFSKTLFNLEIFTTAVAFAVFFIITPVVLAIAQLAAREDEKS